MRIPSVATLVAMVVLSSLAHAGASADANAAPILTIPDQEVWFPHTAMGVGTVRAEACDPDGVISALRVGVGGSSSTRSDGGDACASASHTLARLDPGTRCAQATAWDDHDTSATRNAFLWSTILPFTPDLVPGFPDLGTIPAEDLGTRVVVSLRVAPDGSIGRYQIATQSFTSWSVLAANDVLPRPDDVHVTVELDRPVSLVYVDVDMGPRQELWSGSVRSAGTEWWQVVPVTDTSPAPGGALTPQVTPNAKLECGGVTVTLA